MAAVSALNLEFPSDTGLKPAFNASSTSDSVKSPSGPIRIVILDFGLTDFKSEFFIESLQ